MGDSTWVAGSVVIHIRAQVCQKKNWKQHKKACSTKGAAKDERPFRIQEVPGKGLGMVATRYEVVIVLMVMVVVVVRVVVLVVLVVLVVMLVVLVHGGCVGMTCGVQGGEGRGEDPGGGVPGEPHGAVPGPPGGQEEGGGYGPIWGWSSCSTTDCRNLYGWIFSLGMSGL